MNNIDELKESLCIPVNQVGFILKGQEDLGPNYVHGDPMTFNFNNGVVSFIDEKGISYITPVDKLAELLEKTGYKRDGLFVPYSNSIPQAFQSRWQTLEQAEYAHYFDNKVEEVIDNIKSF